MVIKQKSEEDGTASKRIFTRSTSSGGDTASGGTVGSNGPKCFFCSQQETKEKLREVCTFQVDYRVRKCTHDLQDENLLAKLSAGDLIAKEAKYCIMQSALQTCTIVHVQRSHRIRMPHMTRYVKELLWLS